MGEETMVDQMWVARATTWELLALTLRYPDGTLADAVASGEWALAAAEVADVLELTLPEGWLEGVPGAPAAGIEPPDPAALLSDLRVEATRLFVGAPEPACPPFEGVWRAKEEGVQPLLFVNPHSMEVERFCRACGLGRPEGTNEPLDHAATECELLEHLALRAAGAPVPETAPAAEELPGGSPAAAYETFLAEHARAWMPAFAEHLAADARVPLYRACAHLLAAAVA